MPDSPHVCARCGHLLLSSQTRCPECGAIRAHMRDLHKGAALGGLVGHALFIVMLTLMGAWVVFFLAEPFTVRQSFTYYMTYMGDCAADDVEITLHAQATLWHWPWNEPPDWVPPPAFTLHIHDSTVYTVRIDQETAADALEAAISDLPVTLADNAPADIAQSAIELTRLPWSRRAVRQYLDARNDLAVTHADPVPCLLFFKGFDGSQITLAWPAATIVGMLGAAFLGRRVHIAAKSLRSTEGDTINPADE